MNPRINLYNKTIIVIAYLAAFFYAALKINLVLNYFHTQPGFILNGEFLMEHLHYPGGIGEYISTFVASFLKFQWLGAFIMIGWVALSAWLIDSISRHLFERQINTQFIYLLPLSLALVLWHQLNFPISFIINLSLTLALTRLLINFKNPFFALGGLLLAYYGFGAPFLYISATVFLVENHVKWRQKWVYLAIPALTFAIPALIYKFGFSISLRQAWWTFTQPVPVHWHYTYTAFTYAWLFFSIVMLMVVFFANQTKPRIPKKPMLRTILVTMAILIASFSVLKANREEDSRTEARIAYYAYQQNWKKVLSESKKVKEYNRMVNFYTNQALYFTGNLNTQLFNYDQLLGVDALFIDQPFTASVCMPSSYLYQHLGLINNALRFAYEGQTLKPNSPFVLMQIVDNLIIIGDADNAKRFLNRLKQMLFYANFAQDRLAFIEGKKSTLSADYVALKHQLMPTTDFFVASPLQNIQQLVKANPQNQMAYHYLFTYYLLKDEVGNFVNRLIKSGLYKNKPLPKPYQEALVVYFALSKDPLPESLNWQIDDMVKTRFKSFSQTLGTNKDAAYNVLKQGYADTFWFYFFYECPAMTKAEVKTRPKEIEH